MSETYLCDLVVGRDDMQLELDLLDAAQPAVWTLFSVPAALAPVYGGPGWLCVTGVSVIVVCAFIATASGHMRGETEEMRRRWL